MKKNALKKYVYNKLINPYLKIMIDPTISSLFIKEKKLTPKKKKRETKNAFKRINKTLSSTKYKRFFYVTVNHTLGETTVHDDENKMTFIVKVKNFIVKTIIYLFYRKLYEDISSYNRWTKKIDNIENDINSYMKKTTLNERVDRAYQLNIITKRDWVLFNMKIGNLNGYDINVKQNDLNLC